MALQLVSFVLCPFVQRAVITLREKQVNFSVEYIDLNEPPEWFIKVSPLGKVPILLVDEEVIFESSVILDYLDEVYEPRLHPIDPVKRAQHKSWIEYGSGLLMDQVAICSALDEAEYYKKADMFQVNLGRLIDPIEAGLFADDNNFSLLDAAYAPLFMRMEILRGIHTELSALYPKDIASWAKRLLSRPSVAGSVVEDFASRYIDYFAAKQSWLMRSLTG